MREKSNLRVTAYFTTKNCGAKMERTYEEILKFGISYITTIGGFFPNTDSCMIKDKRNMCICFLHTHINKKSNSCKTEFHFFQPIDNLLDRSP
jgi:hypothetical protein